MDPFDVLERQVFSVVLNTMGEPAIWYRSDGEEISGRVLFRYPTDPITIGDTNAYEYPVNNPTCEWYKDTFIGLKELSDGQHNEFLEIRGKKYFVVEVKTKVDGDNYIAKLELIND